MLTVTAALAVPASASASVGSGTLGDDISYPQCGTAYPSGAGFGIVGVNDGLANTVNPCLGGATGELAWALSIPVSSGYPTVGLYVNTADPGNMYNGSPIADWPQSSITVDPYGNCTTTVISGYTVGENSTACAWQYGYNAAQTDVVHYFSPAATALSTGAGSGIRTVAGPTGTRGQVSEPATGPGRHRRRRGGTSGQDLARGAAPWWLDVETANSWQTGSAGLAMNRADLEGMVYYLSQQTGAQVGIYCTSYQWGVIAGTVPASSPLTGRPDWIPGATSQTGAASNCSLTGFTGPVQLTQWTPRRGPDGDYVC